MADFFGHEIFGDLLPAADQGKGNVLKYIHVRPDRVGLEYHADIALFRRYVDSPGRRVRDGTGNFQLAGVGFLQAGDAAQGGGLTAAAGAEQDAELLLRHFQIYAAQCLHSAAPAVEPFFESANAYQKKLPLG